MKIEIPGGWLFTQCCLLTVHYGFKVILPWWLLWLPSLFMGGIITVIIFILIIAVIGAWISDTW